MGTSGPRYPIRGLVAANGAVERRDCVGLFHWLSCEEERPKFFYRFLCVSLGWDSDLQTKTMPRCDMKR